MRISNLAFVSALAISAAAMPAHAVSYTEGVDVDIFTSGFDALGQPTRIPFVLDAGTNIFTGSLLSPGDPSDVIPFEVQTGMAVISMQVTLNDTQFLLSGPQINLENFFGDQFFSGPLANTNTALNLVPNLYSLLLGNGLAGTGYQVVLNVQGPTAPPAAVPEPATWAMMIGGFAIAGAAMRRRQAFQQVLAA